MKCLIDKLIYETADAEQMTAMLYEYANRIVDSFDFLVESFPVEINVSPSVEEWEKISGQIHTIHMAVDWLRMAIDKVDSILVKQQGYDK